MNAMKWLLGVAVAAAIVAPPQSANAEGGGPYGGGDTYQSYRVRYRGDGYYGDYRGHSRSHRGYQGRYGYHGRHGYHGRPGYYRPYGYHGRPGYYGRPWIGYGGPVVVVPPPPPPW